MKRAPKLDTPISSLEEALRRLCPATTDQVRRILRRDVSEIRLQYGHTFFTDRNTVQTRWSNGRSFLLKKELLEELLASGYVILYGRRENQDYRITDAGRKRVRELNNS